MREVNFDGLVGLTHHYGGLSAGNVASMTHAGNLSNPRQAARQGLAKMRFVRRLGVMQAVLPPHPRPNVRFLRRVGFSGTDEAVIARAAREGEVFLRAASSAAAMWTANAATVAPSSDTRDGLLHLVPANLQSMLHRAIEPETTTAVLRAIFRDPKRFAVHDPLPGGGQLADEGAANHTRLFTDLGAVHVFAWGRRVFGEAPAPQKFPARQTWEASSALARLLELPSDKAILHQQDPRGIDAGAFHTDVLAVGHGHVLLTHERAFIDLEGLLDALRKKLGPSFRAVVAPSEKLPVKDAVSAYPFNSQLLGLSDGSMCIVAPEESRRIDTARAYLESVVAAEIGVREVHYLDLRQSMQNGGGPACLRLRIPMTDAERNAVTARVFIDDALLSELETWVDTHYRERLTAEDLSDPLLWREVSTALDELTRILQLGPVYDFQRDLHPPSPRHPGAPRR